MKVVLGIIGTCTFVLGFITLLIILFLISKDIELVLSDEELNI